MSKTTDGKTDFGGALKNLEGTLEEYLVKKAPFQLPKNVKEIIVKFAPYLAILGVVMGIPGFLALLGAGTILAPLGFVGGMMTGRPFLGVGFIINVLFLGVMVLLEALAIPGLFSQSKKAWTFLYWSALVGVVQNIVSFNVGGLIIGGLLSMYFLFQVKEYYK
ncbi:MAG: hypothetical protein AAB441_04140 [Patescibacteria group bacterium]